MNQWIIEKIEKRVKDEMESLCAAHDFQHIQRVVENAKKIQLQEQKWNILIIEAWALLHESFDEKFFNKESMQQRKQDLEIFLWELDIRKEEVESILFIVANVGYGKSLERDETFQGSIEFEIVEDADRLESIWVIAIARMFTYGWKKGRSIYNPDIPPLQLSWKEMYYSEHESSSFNHFYEKLLLLKDLMHTKTGYELAEPRHEFMKLYMSEFLAEWNWKK